MAQAFQILAGSWRLHFVLEVVERRRDDGERRAELVRQLARERAQVFGVLAQALEQLGEAARERAELVAGARPRHSAADLAARPERRLRGTREPAHAQRKPRGVAEQAEPDD